MLKKVSYQLKNNLKKQKMKIVKIILVALIAKPTMCTIDGLSYMDPLYNKPLTNYPRGEDPCHPLYWYPRNIPEYCQYRTTPKPIAPLPSPPVPIPIPVPQPMPVPLLPPIPAPLPPPPVPMPVFPPPMPLPVPPQFMPMPAPPQFMPMPAPFPAPLPYGIPLAPTNPMVPVDYPSYLPLPFSGYPPYPPPYGPSKQIGMVPGLPDIVSPDGGINIMPFSDAYSDMLEKHKHKMVRKKLQKLIERYEGHALGRGLIRRRNHIRRKMNSD